MTIDRSVSDRRRLAARSILTCLLGLMGLGGFRATAETRTYVVERFTYAMYYDADFQKVCPYGWLPNLEEAFLQSIGPDERKRLMQPENAPERSKRFRGEFTEGNAGEDLCSNPKSFESDPRYPLMLDRAVQSKVAYGLDLDGRTDGAATANSCQHEKFVSPNNQPGIDNQAFRALGCARTWRGGSDAGGDQVQFEQAHMKDGNYNYLIEIRGITDLQNDEVEVGVYSTDDKPHMGLDGKFVPYQTFSTKKEMRFVNTLHGRIVKRVLTTDAVDSLRVETKYPVSGGNGMGTAHERVFRGARFQLTLNGDGTLKGVMGAYEKPEEVMFVGRIGGKALATVDGAVCPLENKLLEALADGYPDPKTGKCTHISLAYAVEATPAFIVHAEAASTDKISAANSD
ncbi:MAG TPA: hypothetical protein VHW71_07865 [Steroidobacteraceae bacterium]|nr:hypothetical protein [Steroidobacteraceae bacterium]